MVSPRLLVSEVSNALRMLQNGECGLDAIQTENAFRYIQYCKNGVSHFDECTARGCIATLYYYEDDTHRVYAPFFDYEEVKAEYRKFADQIPDYNLWDFAVTMNLIYSNHSDLVKKWSKSEESIIKKISDLSVSFLNDEDTNHPTDKIFWYMCGG